MAKGKDAFNYALFKLKFASIKFENKKIKKYWENLIPEIIEKKIEREIENNAQKVELEFNNNNLFSNEKKPKIIICKNTIELNSEAEVILEASSGEDCARLLCISHIIAQRFATSIYLIISQECLESNLSSKPEYIPLPPEYVIRDKTWKPDIIKINHPAISFKRIRFGKGKGPRDQAKLLIISHGKSSLKINNILDNSRADNIRHLELQTLKPVSEEFIKQAMTSVKEIITTKNTFPWLPKINKIKTVDLNQINNLIK